MSIKLVSDFRDIYDHWFDLNGKHKFNRKMRMGPNREEMFYMMFGLGLEVPTHGTVSELYKNAVAMYGSQEEFDAQNGGDLLEVVVYTDIHAHAGDGKLKMTLKEANSKYPDVYASQYLPSGDDDVKSKTWRFLATGDDHYWLEYTSKDDWRSNAGDVSVRLLDKEDADLISSKYHINVAARNIKVPLYAIDFIHGRGARELVAIDFNTAPGIKGTPLDGVVDPQKIATSIIRKIESL